MSVAVRGPAPRGTVGYDEAFIGPGAPRAHYGELFDALAGADLQALRDSVTARLSEAGVTFRTGAGTQTFPVDPIPRLFTAGEWALLAAGLEQRVRALNAFVVDAYGERRIVAAGRMPASVIESADHYEPELRGTMPDVPTPIGVSGLDVVRGADGEFLVLEDNLRTPSGFTYAAAARRVVDAVLPVDGPEREGLCDPLFELLRLALSDASPSDDEPCIVLLSDGPNGSAWYEHADAAERLGVPLVTLDHLEHRGGFVQMRLEDGRSRRVDVVYRRCDEDRLRGVDGRLTAVAEALLEPWRRGRVAVVNGFGTGVGDDKLAHAYVEEMIRFYLGQEPLIRSVPTLDLGRPEAAADVLGRLRDFVIKPRAGHGGRGVVICLHAERADLLQVAEDVRQEPARYIAQETVLLSRHPTVVGGGALEPRHVDLRPFIFSSATRTCAAPGGLTRVAPALGALVVNSSQNGGGKDTWVLC